MVTLIVPIYNKERELDRCLDSLLRQTCREFEIILVDDGSTDSSGAVCDSYAQRHPELVRVIHKPNEGPSSARNRGLDAARGEFVIFPDPDDWVEPDYVQTLLSLQREYQADMVCVGHYVDSDGISAPDRRDQPQAMMSGKDAQRGLLLPPRLQGFSWNKLYRMEIIREQNLRFQEELFITEDLWFAYCYLPHCRRVCYAPSKRIYHYCQSGESITANIFSPRKLGVIRVMEQIREDCAGRDPELAQIAEDEICTVAVNLLWMLVNSGEKDADTMAYLRKNILRTLPGYFRSGIYGGGRKVQALLALICPRLFTWIKNLVQRAKKAM
jgi:GT2 family glycosyltransferase